jgi:probable H4MPT-linked C1 transfer pathway protein
LYLNSYNVFMTTHTLGLDIGGANLKAAHSDGAARTVPFALWKHPEKLPAELRALSDSMPAFGRVAITMTGELCDCFANRAEGVRAILRASQHAYDKSLIRVWSTHGRFLNVADAFAEPMRVASANWLAQAHYVARQFPTENVLLIDTGSTTTDIAYLAQGKPHPRGLTDAERLSSGELVYTGVRRTPICAVLGMEVAAEFFGTMLDAYLCAGLLCEDATDRDTADGRPATREYAHARLARLRCTDGDRFSEQEAHALAERALTTQWDAVETAIERVLAGKPILQRIITAGSGEIVGQCVCSRHPEWRALPTTSLASRLGPQRSEAACAYAVAMLASEE